MPDKRKKRKLAAFYRHKSSTLIIQPLRLGGPCKEACHPWCKGPLVVGIVVGPSQESQDYGGTRYDFFEIRDDWCCLNKKSFEPLRRFPKKVHENNDL